MATYILFWNPDISSYTKERFLDDFVNNQGVVNWSFYEYEDVSIDDTYYMVKCGLGKTGIVMRGRIDSMSYRSVDWSPKNRKNIHYADIDQGVTINPWSEAELLTPEILTELIPDFNWFGGHSGRRLSDEIAEKLDDIWFDYINAHTSIFINKEATIDYYNGVGLPERLHSNLFDGSEDTCEVCGYSPKKIFGDDVVIREYYKIFEPTPVIGEGTKRLIYNICRNCQCVSDKTLAEKLKNLNK